MSQNYTPEFKKKIVRLHEEKGRTYKSILLSMAYPRPTSPCDAANSAKNARQIRKPKKIMTL